MPEQFEYSALATYESILINKIMYSVDQGFSHPLPAGKKCPLSLKKIPVRLWRKMFYCEFCVFTIIRNVSAAYEMPAEL